jgi:hypothetical protein
MGFSVTWYVEKRVIHLKVFGIVTSEEVIDLNRETMAYLEMGIHPVHIIIDTLDVTEYPSNLRWVMRLVQTNPVRPTGWNLLVQNNSTVRVIASTILSLLRLPMHICSTLEEAQNFLETHIYTDVS